MLAITKNDSRPTYRTQDLTTAGVGCIVGQLIPKTGNELHDLRSDLPYTEALLSYLRDGIVDGARMKELRASAKVQPRLLEADWDDLAVEELIVRAAATMHNIRRGLIRFSPRDPQWFKRLPFAFIGWDQAKIFCGALVPVLECLGINDLSDDLIQRAYYEYVASELYKYGFDEAQGLIQAMRILAQVPDVAQLSAEDCALLRDSKFTSARLRRQLERYGIGSFGRMRALAETFGELTGSLGGLPSQPRPVVSEALLQTAKTVF